MLFRLPVPPPGSRRRHSGFTGSSDALALAELAHQSAPLVVITETAAHGQRLFDEIPFFAPKLRIHLLPDWETLPYDSFSPHQDLVSERLATLYQIMQRECDALIVPLTTALYRLPPREYLAAYTFFLKRGEQLAPEKLREQLTLAGYNHVTQVVSPGEYSIRGGLIDLFPMGSALPYRIDLLDDEIETLRTFDVDTQRSIYNVNEIRLLPAREFPLDNAGQTRFRLNFREKFEGDPSKSRMYKDVSQGLAPPGIEYYLPLFFEQTDRVTDYLPANATLCLHRDLMGAAEHFWKETGSRYELLRGDRDRPLLQPTELFLSTDAFFSAIKPFARIEFSADADTSVVAEEGARPAASGPSVNATSALPTLTVERRADDPLANLKAYLAGFKGRALLVAESAGRRETLSDYLRSYGVQPVIVADYNEFMRSEARLMIAAAPLANGFALPKAGLAFITETELYARQARTRSARDGVRRVSTENVLRDLFEVKIGDPVVHEQHGIGRYLGLTNMNLGEGETEFLSLQYESNDKLYVPVAQLHLISRYSGGPAEAAPLHRLGSGHWDKAKRRAAAQIRDTAAELLNLYAQRAARVGHAFTVNQHNYDAFTEAFPFEETPDQAAAIQAVIDDLRAGKPMDRLICGDVGFGKTEVALRAAFIAMMDGKQVAVLVPTTLLAEQHFQNFSDRFSEWPVRIVELSRFRSVKEQTAALMGLADGKIDIAIGTHKLIQKNVKFARLGLVIIDEEHRFGVRQKEQLKALRAEVDVLTLTATPIPRTLAMALEGLRDFSVIATAPQRRLAIKTFVANYSDGLVREAALRELKRGGQIYYLHNEIDTINNVEARLTRLLPEARIRVAHGQMRERELELVMRDFYQQRFNVLLCTTIIETGIDIPTANTIIMHRADKFGLAQLHQLRGRVGRSHHQAYAYLLTPDEQQITAQARKRLEAIQAMEELGAGFYLAMHDLEIRGAGEVLGESQSGEMHEIGFNLYAEMLNSAVKSLKLGLEPDLSAPLGVTTEINLHAPVLLPPDYCNDVHERLVLYKRLANCATLAQLETVHEELIDRFGLLPEPAKCLLETHKLRILAKPLGIARIDAASDSMRLQFIPNPPIDPARVLELVQRRRDLSFGGPDRLRMQASLPEVNERIAAIRDLLRALSPKSTAATE
ncbi:MAG: transcription-repair coupling factor [Burkholderiales bacterium]